MKAIARTSSHALAVAIRNSVYPVVAAARPASRWTMPPCKWWLADDADFSPNRRSGHRHKEEIET